MTISLSTVGANNRELIGYLHDDISDITRTYKERPAVIVCPGGAYAHVSKREEDPAVMPLLAAGYNVFVLRYSVTADLIRKSAPEEEAAEAVAYLKNNSDRLCVDSGCIAILGFSAGGHLAASLACHWMNYGEISRPSVAVLCYPVIVMDKYTHEESRDNVTLSGKCIDYYSLDKQVTGKTVPCYIWHTATDESVHVMNSIRFAEALTENRVQYELHIYPKGKHGLSMGRRETGTEEPSVTGWIDEAISFMNRLWGFIH